VVRRKLAVSSGFVKKKGSLQEGRGGEREILGTRPLRKAPLRRIFLAGLADAGSPQVLG
jgi:hypothetical protein